MSTLVEFSKGADFRLRSLTVTAEQLVSARDFDRYRPFSLLPILFRVAASGAKLNAC
jgi:hypothetical protein